MLYDNKTNQSHFVQGSHQYQSLNNYFLGPTAKMLNTVIIFNGGEERGKSKSAITSIK